MTIPGTQDREVIGEVARALVAEVAPDELARFGALSERYFEDRETALSQGRARAGTRAFGFGAEIVMAPFVLAASSALVGFLGSWLQDTFAVGSREAVKQTVKRLFEGGGGKAAEAPSEAPALSVEQLARIHQMVVDLGDELEVPAGKARLLADSVIGRLATGGAASDFGEST